MTREEAITNYIVPAIKRTWNDKKCKEILEALEQEPKTGHWKKIQSGDKDFPESIVCSRCGHENSYLDFGISSVPIGKSFKKSKYCPNCGAKMVKPQESEGVMRNDNR